MDAQFVRQQGSHRMSTPVVPLKQHTIGIDGRVQEDGHITGGVAPAVNVAGTAVTTRGGKLPFLQSGKAVSVGGGIDKAVDNQDIARFVNDCLGRIGIINRAFALLLAPGIAPFDNIIPGHRVNRVVEVTSHVQIGKAVSVGNRPIVCVIPLFLRHFILGDLKVSKGLAGCIHRDKVLESRFHADLEKLFPARNIVGAFIGSRPG